jgi:hypothetical protein
MGALLTALRRDSPRLFGGGNADLTPLSFEIRESSEVSRVRVTTAAGTRHLFAKVFRPRPGETGTAPMLTRFHRDIQVTRCVFEAMRSTPDLASVEPIAWYDDVPGLVTNEASGLSLKTLISASAAWPVKPLALEQLVIAVRRVGRWIRVFQQIPLTLESGALDLQAVRQYIDTRLEKLVALPRASFTQTDRSQVLDRFDRTAAAVSAAGERQVPVHGDIVPSNVIVGKKNVTVLDFGMTATGSRYLDLARLYTQLDFYRAKPQYRPNVIAHLQKEALEAFQPGLRADEPMFEMCAMQHVVCHFLSHARNPGGFPSSIYSAHLCRRHRRWLLGRARPFRSVVAVSVGLADRG